MNSPFAESPKNLLGGALIGLVLTGALGGVREILTDDPPPPSAWLTETDQEFLAAALDEVHTNDEWSVVAYGKTAIHPTSPKSSVGRAGHRPPGEAPRPI